MVTLDATCSTKRLWPPHADVRMDRDPSVHPDVVADATNTPFKDGQFDVIYCDPPHLVGLNRFTQAAAKGYRRFGAWRFMSDYYTFLDGINREFYRILRPYGWLIYKTTDGSRSRWTTIRVADLSARLTNFVVLWDAPVESHGYFARMHKKAHGTVTLTHYVTLMRREATNHE